MSEKEKRMIIKSKHGVPFSLKAIAIRFMLLSVENGFEKELEKYPSITYQQKKYATEELEKLKIRIRKLLP